MFKTGGKEGPDHEEEIKFSGIESMIMDVVLMKLVTIADQRAVGEIT